MWDLVESLLKVKIYHINRFAIIDGIRNIRNIRYAFTNTLECSVTKCKYRDDILSTRDIQ